jgi:cell division protein FtsZ
MIQAFRAANDVLLGAVQGIADLIVRPGLINVDFADVRTVMSEMGLAMMGTGSARGDDRAQAAAESAIQNPLLDDINLSGANGILVNITAGPDFTMAEFDEVGRTGRGRSLRRTPPWCWVPCWIRTCRTKCASPWSPPASTAPPRASRRAAANTASTASPCARRSSWCATPPPACRSTTPTRSWIRWSTRSADWACAAAASTSPRTVACFVPLAAELPNDYLDIPAFLRRQAD